MVNGLLSRNLIEEIVNEVAQEELRKQLKNVDGIGRTISRKLASKAKAAARGQIESLDDVRVPAPKECGVFSYYRC